MATIPLQQAIEQAKANPTSDFAKQMRQSIESGALDEAAKKQGVDLTKYGRPAQSQNVFERTVSNVSDFIKNPIQETKERLGQITPSERDIAIISGQITDVSPEEKQEAKDKFLNAAMSFSPGGLENAVSKTVKPITQAVTNVTENVSETVKAVVPKTKDAFLKFVSPSIDDTAKTALKKTTTKEFDDMVRVAENASKDAANPSVYESVASSMEDATKQIDSQIKGLSGQKSAIIRKAKNGLTDFTKETGQTILNINKKLPDNATAKAFIAKLKSVKTKVDADRVIDELQNELYKGNKNMTIPLGSTEDNILRQALGEYNSKLKSSLPPAYAKLNSELSERFNTLSALNTALGETVDGVAIRGAGLIKQFFSPAGTKTKQLFKYIQDKTGVDIASKAILAKYVGEAFGDTKIRSLLEGVPSSRIGAIEKVIDFLLEKTGAKGVAREAKKSGVLKKGRALTTEPK